MKIENEIEFETEVKVILIYLIQNRLLILKKAETFSDCPYLVSAAQLIQTSKPPSESKNAFSTLTVMLLNKKFQN